MAYKTDKLKRYIAISHDSTGLFEVKHTLWGQANLRESCQSDPVNIDTMVGGGGGIESVPIDGVSILSGLNFRENIRTREKENCS